MNVSAIIVTRGNVGLGQILESLPIEWERVIWNNGAKRVSYGYPEGGFVDVDDVSVYGRYAAIKYATHDLIYVQDDDCVVSDPRAIAARWGVADREEIWDVGPGEPWGGIVCNMPASRWTDYTDSCLVGWGAVFHRAAPKRAFNALAAHLYREREDAEGDPWLNPVFVEHFHRTSDIVFTTLTPHIKVDLGFEHLPWAELPDRMFKQPNHKAERDQMLELARAVRDAERSAA